MSPFPSNRYELFTGAYVLPVNPIALIWSWYFSFHDGRSILPLFVNVSFPSTDLNNKYPFSYSSQGTPSSPCAITLPSGCQFFTSVPSALIILLARLTFANCCKSIELATNNPIDIEAIPTVNFLIEYFLFIFIRVLLFSSYLFIKLIFIFIIQHLTLKYYHFYRYKHYSSKF